MYLGSQVRFTPSRLKVRSSTEERITEEWTSQPRRLLSCSMASSAMGQLSNLRGCEVHSSVILSSVDERTCKRLGVNLTCEPRYKA